MRLPPRILAALPLAVCLQLVASVAVAEVVVLRRDGTRVVADDLSPRTNADRLAVRRERPGIVLTRFVDWDDIAGVTVDGRPVAFESLRRSAGSQDAVSADEPAKGEILPESVGEPVSLQAAAPPDEQPIRPTAEAGWKATRASSAPDPACAAAGSFPPAPEPMWLAPPLPTRGVVVGVWDDPLSAYADIAGFAYPSGVPVSEAGFALGVLRGARLQQVLGDPIVWPPPLGPLAPPLVPRPGNFGGEPYSIPPAPEPAR